VTFLELKPLTAEQLSAAVKLDQLCLGGLWTEAGYRRELESPNSELLVLVRSEALKLKGSEPLKIESLKGEEAEDLLQNSTSDQAMNLSGENEPTLIGLGCFWAILEEAHITLLGVHPDYQRRGLGQLLLEALLRKAQLRGLEWATLEVRASNQAALSLYQKFGFQEAGRRRRYYKDTDEDALILWRKGLQSPEFAELLVNWQRQISDRLASLGWHLLEVELDTKV